MAPVFFTLAALGAIAGATGVVVLRNPFYNVLALVGHLISLAALFLLLRAEFVAAAQVVVYAGAVMVLYVFVVAYVGGQDEPLGSTGSGLRAVAVLGCGAVVAELLIAVLGSALSGIGGHGAPFTAGFGSPAAIGRMFLTRFLFPFEVASLLLLVAAVGAVILARRRRGLSLGDEPPTALARLRPAYTGTMAEGVGGRYMAERPAVGATSAEPTNRAEGG